MKSRRDEMLREMGLAPVWRRREREGDSGSTGDPPADHAPVVQGVHNRGYLPHLKAKGGLYFVTFRLADSLPQEVLRQLEVLTDEQRSMQVDQYLDAGHGENWLARPEVAEALKKVLLHFDGERYRLHAWVIMPNHAHLLIEPFGEYSLSEIMQGIKSVSAHESNRLLKREGAFWQPERYDHLVRDQEDFDRCRDYILQNPVKAGLARIPQDYVFSSGSPASEKRSAGGSPALQDRRPAGGSLALLDNRRSSIMRMDWSELKASVAACVACPLHARRNRTVFGVGDENADWLFVGEGPGADEDAQGEPFVGQAGKLLDNMLAAINLKRGKNVYIANVIKCRPPGNRNQEPAEALACEPYLHRQIELIRPKLIVALGKVAAVNLLAREASVASLRGKLHEYRGIPLIVTYHPAYLLRSLHDKAKAWADLCYAVETMKGLQSGKSATI